MKHRTHLRKRRQQEAFVAPFTLAFYTPQRICGGNVFVTYLGNYMEKPPTALIINRMSLA